jgi:hypothetical protein
LQQEEEEEEEEEEGIEEVNLSLWLTTSIQP